MSVIFVFVNHIATFYCD